MAFEFPPDDEAHPKRILERLFRDCEEFAEIVELEPKVEVIFRTDEVIKAGKVRLGTCYIPAVQGELRPLFAQLLEEKFEGELPDFLIVLSREFWDAASELERDALVFHEAKHIGQKVDRYGAPCFSPSSGEPIWEIKQHDLEEFEDVVRRYGAWKQDIQRFVDAARDGGVV